MNEIYPLAVAFAAPAHRPALNAVLALDTALGRVVASTSNPLIGQIRLTWWHDRLAGLDAEVIVAQPTLTALSDVVLPLGITGTSLSAIVEGWEAVIDPLPLSDAALTTFATARGDQLFAILARICGGTVGTGMGASWALIDFAMRCSDADTARRACMLARVYSREAEYTGPKPLRILARIARVKTDAPFDEIRNPISRFAILAATLR